MSKRKISLLFGLISLISILLCIVSNIIDINPKIGLSITIAIFIADIILIIIYFIKFK